MTEILQQLSEIGHLPDIEAKSLALRGRYDLAVKTLLHWDKLQIELRDVPGLGSVRNLMYDELKEVNEKESIEKELIRLNDKNIPWYKRERAQDYWTVANEMADVLVLLVADMRLNGMSDEQVFDALVGRAHHNDKVLINEMVARTASLGMDLAEVMILKSEINFQHRDPSMLAWIRGDGFMKRMRRSIGDQDSQIPHLGQGPLGITVLTKLQAPKLVPEKKIDFSNLETNFQDGLIMILWAQSVQNQEGIFAVK